MQDETPKRKVQIDASIFRRIQQGEQEAFRELYDVTYKPLYAFLLSYTLNKEDAQDLYKIRMSRSIRIAICTASREIPWRG